MRAFPRRQRLMLAMIAARLALNVWEAWAEESKPASVTVPRRCLETTALWLDNRVPIGAVDSIAGLVTNAAVDTPGSLEDDAMLHPAWYAAQSVLSASGKGNVHETRDGGEHEFAPATAVVMAALATMDPHPTTTDEKAAAYERFFTKWWDIARSVKALG